MRLSSPISQVALLLAIASGIESVCWAQREAEKGSSEIAASNSTAPGMSTSTPSKASPLASEVGDSYRIGAGDSLQISVWHEPDLSVPVVVRPDGMITLPLINDVPVVGLTPKELQALLGDKLKRFVAEPAITINVTGVPSRKFYLLGQVAHQGVFLLPEKQTVLGAIVEAGGPTPFAKLGSIYVLRQSGNKPTKLPFNFKKAIRGERVTEDIQLLPGDTIVVP